MYQRSCWQVYLRPLLFCAFGSILAVLEHMRTPAFAQIRFNAFPGGGIAHSADRTLLRYKIAGQWYGIPKLFSPSKTLKIQVVSDTPTEIIFKMRQQYTPKVLKISKIADSLISLSLDADGKVKYHKDM
jgi:hypothetical protein